LRELGGLSPGNCLLFTPPPFPPLLGTWIFFFLPTCPMVSSVFFPETRFSARHDSPPNSFFTSEFSILEIFCHHFFIFRQFLLGAFSWFAPPDFFPCFASPTFLFLFPLPFPATCSPRLGQTSALGGTLSRLGIKAFSTLYFFSRCFSRFFPLRAFPFFSFLPRGFFHINTPNRGLIGSDL